YRRITNPILPFDIRDCRTYASLKVPYREPLLILPESPNDVSPVAQRHQLIITIIVQTNRIDCVLGSTTLLSVCQKMKPIKFDATILIRLLKNLLLSPTDFALVGFHQPAKTRAKIENCAKLTLSSIALKYTNQPSSTCESRIWVVVKFLYTYKRDPYEKPRFQQLSYRKLLDLSFMMVLDQAALCFTWNNIRDIAKHVQRPYTRRMNLYFVSAKHIPKDWMTFDSFSIIARASCCFSKLVCIFQIDKVLVWKDLITRVLDTLHCSLHYFIIDDEFMRLNSTQPPHLAWFATIDYPLLYRLTPNHELQSSHIKTGIDVYFMRDPHSGLVTFGNSTKFPHDRPQSLLDRKHVILLFPIALGELTTSMVKLEGLKFPCSVQFSFSHRLDLLVELNLNEKFPDAFALRTTCEKPAAVIQSPMIRALGSKPEQLDLYPKPNPKSKLNEVNGEYSFLLRVELWSFTECRRDASVQTLSPQIIRQVVDTNQTMNQDGLFARLLKFNYTDSVCVAIATLLTRDRCSRMSRVSIVVNHRAKAPLLDRIFIDFHLRVVNLATSVKGVSEREFQDPFYLLKPSGVAAVILPRRVRMVPHVFLYNKPKAQTSLWLLVKLKLSVFADRNGWWIRKAEGLGEVKNAGNVRDLSHLMRLTGPWNPLVSENIMD
ncbi:hypothetical protein CLF_102042, partial [Clonorchis sinensis]